MNIDVEGFLFDMDGTLVDSTAVVERVWGDLCRRHSIDPMALVEYAHGRQAQVTINHFLAHEPEEVRDAEYARVLREETEDMDGVVAVPGAPELLARLRELGAPYALVTSAPLDLATARMAAAGLDMPPVVVTAERVAHSKPHPEGFLLGAEELGVDAEDCLGFEDASAGIAAVLASGASLVIVGHKIAGDGGTQVADLRNVQVSPHGDAFRVTIPS